jgi:hypothetical protein
MFIMSSDNRQIEIHAVEPLGSDPSQLEVEIAITNTRNCIYPATVQTPAELFQAGGETLVSV